MTTKQPTKQVGRPKRLDDRWAKVNLILYNRNIVFLDRLAADIREQTASPVTRAEVLRDLLDQIENDQGIRERLVKTLVELRD